MPFAEDSYTGDGSTREFNISFAYIEESHIKVALDEANITAFTVDTSTSPKKVVLTALSGSATSTQETTGAPKTGVAIVVYRDTPLNNPVVDYTDGSTLIADDLDTSNKQWLYLLQEQDDEQAANIQSTIAGQDAQNKKIINVADPTAAQHAATKNYVDTNFQPLDAELTELATMGSTTASSLADLTQAEVQILDGATVTTAELNTLDGITATTTELNTLDGVTSTAAELNVLDGITATTAELNILDGVTATAAEINALDGITSSAAELNILDGATVTTAELNTLDGITSTVGELNILDGVTSNASELNVLDGITASTAELNQLDGKTISGTLTPSNTDDIPTSSAVNSYVSGLLNALGGFVAIADENSFPTTNPDPSDNAGTIVSIANAGGMSISSSGVGTGQTTGGTTVTINGFPSTFNSTTIQDGLGLQVQTTSTLNTYTYHKVYAKDEDVRQLSQDVNDFKARYRVGSSNPTTDLDSGDLFFNTGSGKMLVYNGQNTAWEEVQSIGEFFINTISSSSGTGGGSATFNGTAYRFTLSNAPTNAEQLLVSVNGVVQKPNSGTSQPSEGFAIDGADIIFSSAPATSAPFFIVTIGSSVNIGTPSNNTVTADKIVDGTITNAKISSSAAIAGTKIANDAIGPDQLADTAVTAGSYTLSSITVDAQGRITAASSGSAGASDAITEGNTTVECVDTGSDGHITFDTEGSERMRIDSAGDILVSKTGAGNGSNTDVITLDNNNSSSNDNLKTSIAFKRTGNNSNYIYSRISSERTGTHDTDIVFATNYGGSLSEELRIKANGGVTFNGDTATANALDDYEEGTFTPTIGAGVTSPTYTNTGGNYTKIGDCVFFTIRMQCNGGTEVAQHVQIHGLPFTSSSSKRQGGGSWNYSDNIGNSITVELHIPANTTRLEFFHSNGNVWNGNAGNGIINEVMHIHGQYFV